MSLPCNRRLCVRGVWDMPMCAGVRFEQVRLTGARIKWCGTGVSCPSRVTGVFCTRSVRYVPVCAGVRFVQYRLTAAHVRGFGTGV